MNSSKGDIPSKNSIEPRIADRVKRNPRRKSPTAFILHISQFFMGNWDPIVKWSKFYQDDTITEMASIDSFLYLE